MNCQDIIGKAIVYIENHLYEPLKTLDVANEVSYSYYHFQRYFSAVMGESVSSYIRNRRLTQAAWDLVHTQKKILDIGTSLYFESAECFTRAFKSRFGITPSQYRKNGIDTLICSHKPIASKDISLLQHIAFEPEIIEIPTTIMVGIRFQTSISENNSIEMWNLFNKKMNAYATDNSKNRYEIYEGADSCSTESFNDKCTVNAFIGIEYTEKITLNSDLQLKELTGGKYAKFVHIGKIENLLFTYQYIWGIWFPKSGYKLAKRDDFECYTSRFLGVDHPDSEIDIYFPIE